VQGFIRANRSGPLATEARRLVSSINTKDRTLKSALSLAVLGLVALLIATGSAASNQEFAATTKVNVTMTDYAFALSKKTVRTGTVIFQVVNKGEVVHDFKIARKKTPIYEAGQGGALRVVFKNIGRYPFICTIPGHAAIGMKGVLKVIR